MVNKHLQDAINLDEKGTHSDKVFNTAAVVSSIISLALLLVCVVAYAIHSDTGLLFFKLTFYPMLAFNIAGIYLSFAQVFRNRYLSAVIGATLSVATLISLIVIIILQIVLLKTVHIIPFNFI